MGRKIERIFFMIWFISCFRPRGHRRDRPRRRAGWLFFVLHHSTFPWAQRHDTKKCSSWCAASSNHLSIHLFPFSFWLSSGTSAPSLPSLPLQTSPPLSTHIDIFWKSPLLGTSGAHARRTKPEIMLPVAAHDLSQWWEDFSCALRGQLEGTVFLCRQGLGLHPQFNRAQKLGRGCPWKRLKNNLDWGQQGGGISQWRWSEMLLFHGRMIWKMPRHFENE